MHFEVKCAADEDKSTGGDTLWNLVWGDSLFWIDGEKIPTE